MLLLLLLLLLAAVAAAQEPWNGIPPGVNCSASVVCATWPELGPHCARVCQPGTVQQAAWARSALQVQRALSRRKPLCQQQFPGSHNSAITLTSGYGLLDDLMTAYLQRVLPGELIRTNDQWLSLTDQLELGARLLELDTHWVLDELRIAHCGGVRVPAVDDVVKLLDWVAHEFGLPPIPWDSVDIGCWPSGSGIPAKDQRSLASALAEIAQWLQRHPDEFLMLYFDDQPEMLQFHKVPVLLSEVQAAFGAALLTPQHWLRNTSVTVHELVQQGKRVLLTSRTNYGAAAMNGTLWNHSFCGWSEPGVQDIDVARCTVRGAPTMAGTLFRPETTMLSYGPVPGVYDAYQLNATTLPPIVACGINIPSPDSITPQLMEAHIWSFAPGQLLGAQGCAVMTQASSRWRVLHDAAACSQLPSVAAPLDGKQNAALFKALQHPAVRLVLPPQ